MSKISLHSIEIAGFRAYLAPQTIELHSKNLAIFAPNGRGKSSLADAIEFYLSPATTLPRFGEKATGNQAGYTALAHNAAEKADITPSVTLKFRARGETFGTVRLPDGKMPRTEAGNRVAAHHRVDAVVRGHALRGFVEDTSPDKRYTQVSDWLSLSSLTEAQKAIKALRDQVGMDVKDTANRASAERRVSRLTGETVRTWDSAALASWMRRTYLDKLGLGEVALEFRPNAALAITLRALVREEEAKVGLTALKQRLAAIQTITARPDADGELSAGYLVGFENAARSVDAAAEVERAERAAAAESAFHDVWTAAAPLLCSGDVAYDACPVCSSTWVTTPHGSRSATHAHVVASLASLESYERASKIHIEAKRALETCCADLKRALAECSVIFKAVDSHIAEVCEKAAVAFATWHIGDATPCASELVTVLTAEAFALAAQIQAAQQEQDQQFPAKAQTAFDTLVEIFGELEDHVPGCGVATLVLGSVRGRFSLSGPRS